MIISKYSYFVSTFAYLHARTLETGGFCSLLHRWLSNQIDCEAFFFLLIRALPTLLIRAWSFNLPVWYLHERLDLRSWQVRLFLSFYVFLLFSLANVYYFIHIIIANVLLGFDRNDVHGSVSRLRWVSSNDIIHFYLKTFPGQTSYL